MKYIYSGVAFSLTPTCYSLKCINYMSWCGIICYSVCIMTFFCILVITYPGDDDVNKIQVWFENTLTPIDFWTLNLWVTFNILSTAFAVYGIRKMLQTLELFKRGNSKIKTNKLTFILHCVVLVLNTLAVLFDAISLNFFYGRSALIGFYFVTAMDVIVQLCICYICWTVGSSRILDKKKPTIKVDR
jgi:hypothetical protein